MSEGLFCKNDCKKVRKILLVVKPYLTYSILAYPNLT